MPKICGYFDFSAEFSATNPDENDEAALQGLNWQNDPECCIDFTINTTHGDWQGIEILLGSKLGGLLTIDQVKRGQARFTVNGLFEVNAPGGAVKTLLDEVESSWIKGYRIHYCKGPNRSIFYPAKAISGVNLIKFNEMDCLLINNPKFWKTPSAAKKSLKG